MSMDNSWITEFHSLYPHEQTEPNDEYGKMPEEMAKIFKDLLNGKISRADDIPPSVKCNSK